MPTNYNVTRPPFVADWDSVTRDTGHTIDWAKVGEEYRETPGGTITVSAVAAQNAVAITVTALPIALAAGTVLDFGGAKFARLTAAAAKGATNLTVAALVTALAGNETATVAGRGKKHIPAGTAMGDAGADGRIYPRVVTTNPAKFLLATPATEDAEFQNRGSYGVIRGGVIYENLLPGGAPVGAVKTELAAAGTGFSWATYRDTTA